MLLENSGAALGIVLSIAALGHSTLARYHVTLHRRCITAPSFSTSFRELSGRESLFDTVDRLSGKRVSCLFFPPSNRPCSVSLIGSLSLPYTSPSTKKELAHRTITVEES